jgi:hypothetical protein
VTLTLNLINYGTPRFLDSLRSRGKPGSCGHMWVTVAEVGSAGIVRYARTFTTGFLCVRCPLRGLHTPHSDKAPKRAEVVTYRPSSPVDVADAFLRAVRA